jgi:hypothetical protein
VKQKTWTKSSDGLAGKNRNAATVTIALFFVNRKLNEVERIQRLDQTVAEFLKDILRLQLGEESKHHLRICGRYFSPAVSCMGIQKERVTAVKLRSALLPRL